MKVAIVGSRQRSTDADRASVEALVDSLKRSDKVVSGGCRGVDSWAIDRAIKRGLSTLIYFPKIRNAMEYGSMVNEYYARNRKVVDDADIVYAFPIDESKGGTGYTIKYARSKGKKVVIK
jgi:hypothetical protein